MNTTASMTELETALQSELTYVENHLDEYPDYCILNLCRLVYSFETRDVVISKASAAEWACEALPGWRHVIDMARGSYPGKATREDRKRMREYVRALYEEASARIAQQTRL